jgi:hypothetical protein
MARIMATSSPANGSKAVSPKEVVSSMERERLDDDGEDEYVRSCCVISRRSWCSSAAKQLVSMSSATSPLAGGPVIWMSSPTRKLAVQLVE